jgi:hypothetical protein
MMGRERRFRRRDKAPGRGSGRASSAQEPWLRRQARGLRPDRNPLRRGTDRVEACLLAGLFVAAAAGAPLAAQAASRAAHDGAAGVQKEQLATRHQVPAVLTQPAGRSVDGYTLSADVPTLASWKSVTGMPGSGEVLAPAGLPKGASVTVWTDPNGDLVSPPITDAQVAGQGDAGAIGAVAAIVVVFFSGTGVIRYVLYRRRMAAWEADWLLTAPTWNRQSW